MATSYPGTIDSQPTVPSGGTTLGGGTTLHTAMHQNHEDQINAIETTLGVNPHGFDGTVARRFGAASGVSAWQSSFAKMIGLSGKVAPSLHQIPTTISSIGIATGTMYLCRLGVDFDSTTVSTIAALGVTGPAVTSFYAGLYAATPTNAAALIATSANLASSYTTVLGSGATGAGWWTFTIPNSSVTHDTDYYVAFLPVGATVNIGGINFGTTVPAYALSQSGAAAGGDSLAYTSGSSLTALPSTVNLTTATPTNQVALAAIAGS